MILDYLDKTGVAAVQFDSKSIEIFVKNASMKNLRVHREMNSDFTEYLYLSKLPEAEGGFAKIFKVNWQNEKYALKLLKDKTKASVQLFLREIALLR